MTARRLLLALLLALPLHGAIAPAARDAVVELPPFVITESPVSEKAWRYAEAEGFEIISQVDDATAQQIFAALWRGPRLTLPAALWPRNSTPTAVIIFDQEMPGLDTLGSVRQRNEQHSHWTNLIKRTLADRGVFAINLAGRDFAYSSTFRFDLRTLLALRTPAVPPWLYEALHGTYGLYREGIGYPDRGTHTDVIPGLWCTEAELIRAEQLIGPGNEFFLTAPMKRAPRTAPLRDAVAAPESLWEGGLPGDKRTPADAARWAATCALFARWGLYAEEGKHHDAFWRFAVAACERPVDEAMFREHFGMSYAEARNEWGWFLPITIGERAARPIKPLVPPKIVFRPASEAEVARVRGDWERGEAALLANRFPDIAAKYSAKASRTLRTAHAHDASDWRLTEVLALLEFEQGDNTAALRLLEESTAAGQGRPRAWFTLAHLRLLNLNARLGAKAALPREDAMTVLLPLEQALRQEPAMAVAFELAAELWRRAPELPAEEILRHLQEGQRRFPRQTRLTLASFRTCLERGQRDAALDLLDRAIPLTTDATLREGLEKTARALRQAKPRS
jgi:tetratricopeptide (TPR) repeat protein